MFVKQIKVCFSDIDNAGIVYYPRFLHYFHLTMEDFFENQIGIDYADMLHRKKVSFPTVHVECDFRKKLKYGDRIDIEIQIIQMGNSSIKWGYTGYRTEGSREIIVEGSNTTVCVHNDTFEKISIPHWLREMLEEYTSGISGS